MTSNPRGLLGGGKNVARIDITVIHAVGCTIAIKERARNRPGIDRVESFIRDILEDEYMGRYGTERINNKIPQGVIPRDDIALVVS